MQIRFGADIFSGQAGHYRGKKFGLVTNEAATISSGTPARQALLSAGHDLIRLFSPEHGLERRGEDGREMPDGKDGDKPPNICTSYLLVSYYENSIERARPAAHDRHRLVHS